MSNRERSENATRKGKVDYYNGVTFDANPMKSMLSRQEWETAWLREKMINDNRNALLQRRVDRNKANYFFSVEM